MVEPRVIPRAEHPISRRDIDPDALKVLYRLRQSDHVAYLVGGSVRDLLLRRRPKDFDIGTSAHPYQVKKLFRNCWIIGRRFRLVHVKFGTKVIEVATFRRQVEPGEEPAQAGPAESPDAAPSSPPPIPMGHAAHELLVHRDNTFGTPEEDAFRRDFTINALFYDIATFSIIDYVGGLEDLEARLVRSIGDPEIRFREDPVRMLRAIALAARLDFTLDPGVVEAIRTYRHEIARSSPPRLLEEYYKILRTGAAEKTFRMLADVGLLEPISVELQRGASAEASLWRSLGAIDAYRRQFPSTPETLTNPILLGTLVAPLGIPLEGRLEHRGAGGQVPEPSEAPNGGPGSDRRPPAAAPPKLGLLPLPRRDVERLRQILALQRRFRDVHANLRAQRSLARRHVFPDALAWFEIHGGSPDAVAHWKGLQIEAPLAEEPGAEGSEPRPFRRRRRRRRRARQAP